MIPVQEQMKELFGSGTLRHDTVSQRWWGNVAIIEVVPSQSISEPPPDSLGRFRVAIDDLGRSYRLWGYPRNDFNRLLSDHPLNLKSGQLRSFGEFYLRSVCYFDWGRIYFVTNTQDLLRVNRSLLDKGKDLPPGETWDSIHNRIVSICRDQPFHRVEQATDGLSWLVDFLVWRWGCGDLDHYRLRIWKDGCCEVVESGTVAHKLGLWEWLKL
jgi:hypothetical protein